MKYSISIASLIFIFSFRCFAQSNNTNNENAISFELGKTGLIYNLSFDHRFKNKNFGLRASAGSTLAKYLNLVTIGGGGYYLLGKNRNYFELGLELQSLVVDETSDDQRGLGLFYPDYPTHTVYPSMNIGYRNYGRKTLFRAGVAPGIINSELKPGGYIGFGITF